MTTALDSHPGQHLPDGHMHRQLTTTLVFVSGQSAAADISDASGKRPYQSLGYGTADHADRLSLTPERRLWCASWLQAALTVRNGTAELVPR